MARIITKKTKQGERTERNVARILALLVLILLMIVVMVALPLIQRQREKAETYACNLAMRKAQDVLIAEFLADPEMTVTDAAVVVDRSKLEMDSLCPAGGDFYLVPESGAWHVTCGVHEQDLKLRTRLNASRVFDLLEDRLEELRQSESQLQPSIFYWEINGQQLEVSRLEGNNGLRRGTDYSIDFDGVVCFYALNSRGELHWFVYADSNHAAVWKEGEGWSGDAYSKS